MIRRNLIALAVAMVSLSATAGQVLNAEEQLLQGQYISSRSGIYAMILQSDGNAVLYFNGVNANGSGNRTAGWATNTSNGHHLRMQIDGNLALYKSDNSWAWTSGSGGKPYNASRKLVLHEDGRLIIYGPEGQKVLKDIDKGNPTQGGPVAQFPIKKIVNGVCQQELSAWAQSAYDANLAQSGNGYIGSIGYCDSPY